MKAQFEPALPEHDLFELRLPLDYPRDLGNRLLVAVEVELEVVFANSSFEIGKRPAKYHLTAAQHSRVIAHLVDITQIMTRNNQSFFAGERLDQVQHGTPGLDIKSVSWLVPNE